MIETYPKKNINLTNIRDIAEWRIIYKNGNNKKKPIYVAMFVLWGFLILNSQNVLLILFFFPFWHFLNDSI